MFVHEQELNLPERYKNRVKDIVKYLQEHIDHGEAYLFGSYAKRRIKETSDIDVLVLVDTSMNLEEMRVLRIYLNNTYEEEIEYTYEVDIKVYPRQYFLEKTEYISFEREINEYMIKVGEW